jgi:hypothetical protein
MKIIHLKIKRMNRFKHKKKLFFGDKIDCKYWDFNTTLWSSSGCHRVKEESDFYTTVCRCSHLSNFAALMDISGREGNTSLKEKMTLFFSGISVICLLITLISVILSYCNKTKEEKANDIVETSIFCNISLCLILVNIVVIFGMDKTDEKV